MINFYQSDEFSRMMPGKKDFFIVKKNQHVQRLLLLYWVLNSKVICLISAPTTVSGCMCNIFDLDLKNISSWLHKKIAK